MANERNFIYAVSRTGKLNDEKRDQIALALITAGYTVRIARRTSQSGNIKVGIEYWYDGPQEAEKK